MANKLYLRSAFAFLMAPGSRLSAPVYFLQHACIMHPASCLLHPSPSSRLCLAWVSVSVSARLGSGHLMAMAEALLSACSAQLAQMAQMAQMCKLHASGPHPSGHLKANSSPTPRYYYCYYYYCHYLLVRCIANPQMARYK